MFGTTGYATNGRELAIPRLRELDCPKTIVHATVGRGDCDFGWAPEWMNGLGLTALASLAGAVAMVVVAPAFWPVAIMLIPLAAAFFAGNLIMRSFRSRDHIVLPMIRLLKSDKDLMLDAGCGSGRTTIALGRILRSGHVTAVDRFDSDYTDEGGRRHIDLDLAVAGLTDRVTRLCEPISRLCLLRPLGSMRPSAPIFSTTSATGNSKP